MCLSLRMTFNEPCSLQRRRARHIDITDESDAEIDGVSKSFEGVH